MALIQVENLYKVFGPRPKEALGLLKQGKGKQELMEETGHAVGLHDVSLSVEAGETFVVMGLSGSGKSTLIRCLNRLIQPTAGRILVHDQDVMSLSDEGLRQLRQRKMTMVFQRFGLLPHRTILQNIAYGLEVQGVPRPEREARAMQWLETVGLKGWENSHPHQLSGGMQQRVGIARALCNDPEILLMDEPFSALDPLIRREMQDELISLQSRLNKTIVFITHDLDEALRLGDHIAILKDGKVIQIGTPEEILTQPADDYVVDFTRDVNRIRVLTARSVMVQPRALVSDRSGPRAAIKMMEERGLSSLFVVDRENRFQGLVTVDDAIPAVQQGVKEIRPLLVTGTPTTGPDTVMEELLPVAAQHKWPIAVLDEKGVLLGIIPRVAVLAGLASGGRRSEEPDIAESVQSDPVELAGGVR